MQTLIVTDTVGLINRFFGEIPRPWLVIIVLIITALIASLFSYYSGRFIRRAMKLRNADLTRSHFLRHAFTGLIYIIGIAISLSFIPSLKTLGNSLLAGAGILSIIVGMAAQESIGNLFSGIMIVVFKPFEINDKIKIKGVSGVVEDINLRQVVLRDSENNRIVLPNTIVNSELIINSNMTDLKVSRLIEVSISIDSNITQALEIMQEEAMKHPNHIDNRTRDERRENVPEVKAKVIAFTDFGIKLRVWVWSRNSDDAFEMHCDLLKSIKERFDADGISLAIMGNVSPIIKKNPI